MDTLSFHHRFPVSALCPVLGYILERRVEDVLPVGVGDHQTREARVEDLEF